MPVIDFQLPRSSYNELTKIIKAYRSAGPDSNLADVSARSAINKTVVSSNHKFLIASDILMGGQKKSLTNPGDLLARALDYDMPSRIEEEWRKIVQDNEFFEKILTALRIRKGMDIGALRSHIAFTAGEKRSSSVLTGANAIIDILRASGLIKDQDGKVVTIDREHIAIDHPEERDEELVQTQTIPEVGFVAPSLRDSGLHVALNIEVRINCTPENLDELGSKLKAIIEELVRVTETPQE